jgi:hypothetical protein
MAAEGQLAGTRGVIMYVLRQERENDNRSIVVHCVTLREAQHYRRLLGGRGSIELRPGRVPLGSVRHVR